MPSLLGSSTRCQGKICSHCIVNHFTASQIFPLSMETNGLNTMPEQFSIQLINESRKYGGSFFSMESNRDYFFGSY
jgi:hypothetical protein